MSRKTVKLNGVDFALSNNELRIEPFEAWAEPVRVIGNQRRGDRINASQWVFEDLTFGLGFFTTQGDPPIDGNEGDPSFRGFFNSTLETRWSGQITLAGLIEDVTHEKDNADASDHTYKRFFEAANLTTPVSTGLYTTSHTASESVGLYNGGTNEVTQFEALGANEIYRAIFNFEGRTYLAGGADGSQLATMGHITFGGVWGDTTPTWPDANGVPISGAVFRGVAYILAFYVSNGNVKLWSAADPTGTWTDEGIGLSLTGYRYAELVVYRDASGRPALFAMTDEGLHLLDLGNAEPLMAMPMPQRADENLRRVGRPIVHKGRLYVPMGPSLWEYHFTGAYRDISPLTQARIPTGVDGFKPAAGNLAPQITSVASGSDWLFVAFSGWTKGSVWAYDGAGYHYIWSKLSGDTDLIHINDLAIHYDRTIAAATLFVMFEEENATDNVDFEKIENILDDPLQLASKKFANDGFIITPHTDGGMSEVDGAIIQIGIGASDLLANNEDIDVATEYDFSGTWTDEWTFDNINPNIRKLPMTPTADIGIGVSARRWRHRVTLSRNGGVNTDTPVFYNLVSYFEKVFPDLFKYSFEVDIRETKRINMDIINDDDIVEALMTARASVPLIKFEYNDDGDKFVRVDNFPHIVSPPDEAGADDDLDDARILVELRERVP
jgi:hypothetical protein